MLHSRLSWRRPLAVALTVLATSVSGLAALPAQAANIATPGNFTGYGFDQCTAPTQRAMDAWLTSSPFWAVGIYISGDSRGCPSQPNLTPTWVDTQLRNGWRLLPITLGPQASCTTRERYLKQVRISPDPANSYARAREQGRQEAVKTVGAARALGIAAGSTLWYDLEAFDIRPTNCRESALSFLHAWTNKMHGLGYVSGVYSSAASGMKMLDDARALRPGKYTMPDRVWIADWNGRADLRSSYIRSGGWMPHARVHQYRGGHNETHGGVTINIDSNYMSLGRGSVAPRKVLHCRRVDYDRTTIRPLRRGTGYVEDVKMLQCLLKERRLYAGKVHGSYDAATERAVKRWEASRGLLANGAVSRANWMTLLTEGATPVLKYGSAGSAVLRLQRALNAGLVAGLRVNGVYGASTAAAVRSYQSRVGLPANGVVASSTWGKLRSGAR
jgi:hypothetical protein